MAKKLFREKKSIMFTIFGVILTIVIILAFSVETEYRQKDEMESIKIRVRTMNDLILDVEKDLSRGLFIIGFNSLLALENSITSNGTYIENVGLAFEDALLRGTIDGEKVDLLTNNTFPDWKEDIGIQADKIGVTLNITVDSVTISQEDPWSIKMSVVINLSAIDKKGTSSWTRSKNIITKLDIQNFEDPIYAIGSFGRVVNPIRKSIFTNFAVLDELQQHINGSYYIASSTAPNFLMRMGGNFSASANGIESVVNIDKLSDQQLQIFSRSNVDYIYFGSQSHSNCLVNETQSTNYDWFRLDSGSEPLNHLDNYQVNCEP